MSEVTYRIVEHDGGFAYKVGDVFSETFATHGEALDAARRAATEQGIPGSDTTISYQDGRGIKHEELSRGDDRPHTHVEDS